MTKPKVVKARSLRAATQTGFLSSQAENSFDQTRVRELLRWMGAGPGGLASSTPVQYCCKKD